MADHAEPFAATICIVMLIIYLLNEITGSTVAPTLLLFAGVSLLVMLFLFQQYPH